MVTKLIEGKQYVLTESLTVFLLGDDRKVTLEAGTKLKYIGIQGIPTGYANFNVESGDFVDDWVYFKITDALAQLGQAA